MLLDLVGTQETTGSSSVGNLSVWPLPAWSSLRSKTASQYRANANVDKARGTMEWAGWRWSCARAGGLTRRARRRLRAVDPFDARCLGLMQGGLDELGEQIAHRSRCIGQGKIVG